MKKIFNLCLRWHTLRSYCFVADATFKVAAKKCDLSENNVNVASDPNLQKYFFNTIQTVRLDILSHGELLALALWNHCKNWNLGK